MSLERDDFNRVMIKIEGDCDKVGFTLTLFIIMKLVFTNVWEKELNKEKLKVLFFYHVF